MLNDSSRAAALRRPQGGTPPEPLSEDQALNQLVGDIALIDLGQQSASHAVLCGVLLRVQIRTYRRHGHIISYSDEYTMRRIRNAAKTGRLPHIYCRCLRCGCLALLLDWCVAVDLADDPVMPARRFAALSHRPVDDKFYHACEGSKIAENGLLLMD